MAVSVHRRRLDAATETVGEMIDALGTSQDRLWPSDRWPPMRFDGTPQLGAAGGHGPIRYTLEWKEPRAAVWYRFTSPRGFEGGHGFFAHPAEGGTLLEHRLEMRTSGWARITWPLVLRPLHDALIADCLWRAADALGSDEPAPRWSLWVRLLRRILPRRS